MHTSTIHVEVHVHFATFAYFWLLFAVSDHYRALLGA